MKLRQPLKNITFATLVYYAKQNGYKPESKRDYSIRQKPVNQKRESKRINFIDSSVSYLYRFADEIEERLAIMEYEKNIPQAEAEKIILSEMPGIEKVRTYRITVNKKVKDKSKDYKKLNECFENCNCTAKEIADYIGQGFSIICAKLKVNDNGKIERVNDNWICSELIALDIDSGLSLDEAYNIPLTKHALLIYTSPSHTLENHRFRILFDLPYLETDKQIYREILQNFISLYNADNQCSDPVRIYFGNSNSTIYLLRTDEIIYYKNGKLNEIHTT